MITSTVHVPDEFLKYRQTLPLSDHQPLIFLDIETMGLSRQRDPIILIGIMLLGSKDGVLIQHFCQTPADEKEMLTAVIRSIPPGSMVVTYNGRAFDIPYINQRLTLHDIPLQIPAARNIDLMYWARKALPAAPRHTLKAVEIALEIHREDTLSGADCVQQYQSYLKTKEPSLAEEICRHNFEDILHMAPLLQLYAMLPAHSPLRSLPFCLTLERQDFWMEAPLYKNGFLSLSGSSEGMGARGAVSYSGSASLEILKGRLVSALPAIEFTYPEPESLFIDPDRIPGLLPHPFNMLPLEEKMALLVRRGSCYDPDALSSVLNRLLQLNR